MKPPLTFMFWGSPHPWKGLRDPSMYTMVMELWHVLNRGVDGRTIFMDSRDYVRFVHNLYEFNDTAPADNSGRDFSRRSQSKRKGLVNHSFDNKHRRERLVDIHGWVLMKNHYHLLLSERREGGLSLFLRKMNTGYANYFNALHERKGALFQGRTKKILIQQHAHFLYILHYVHLNPLDYLKGSDEWRIRSKRSIKGSKEALEYLVDYKWSSYRDYVGQKNFPSILTTALFKESLGDYKTDLMEYLKDSEAADPNQLSLSLE